MHQRRRAVRRAAVLALVAGTAVTLLPGAQAAPAPSISQVERTVTTLRDQAEQASERYNETRESMAAVAVRLKAAQTRHEQQKLAVAMAQRSLGRIAAETYRRGQVSTLTLVLSDDPSSVLEQAGVTPSLAGRQTGALRQLRLGEAQLATDEKQVAAQKAELARAEATLKAERATVDSKLAQAEHELSQLQASARAQLLRASRDRERQALDSVVGADKAAVIGSDKAAGSCAQVGIMSPSARIQAVLDAACAQLGDPYQWGADGPNSWDCSGLTRAAWAAAGVSLPHSSAQQASYGTPVSASQLQAGDLVFYYTPISHVALYVGNGLMLHAPSSGDVVKIVPLRSGMTTAVRL